MKEKGELRKSYLGRRNALAPSEVLDKSAAICRHLMETEAFRDSRTILSYVSMDKEVDTHRLIASMIDEGRTVAVPIVRKKPLLDWSILERFEDLEPSTFGILEPRAGKQRLLDLPSDAPVLVPGIAFTPTGHRIGYGGGFFDHFLATHVGRKIGLAFEIQLVPKFPIQPYDIPVDLVITESGLRPQ